MILFGSGGSLVPAAAGDDGPARPGGFAGPDMSQRRSGGAAGLNGMTGIMLDFPTARDRADEITRNSASVIADVVAAGSGFYMILLDIYDVDFQVSEYRW